MLAKVALSVAAGALCLLLAELGLRLFWDSPLREPTHQRDSVLRLSDDPLVQYELNPGAVGRSRAKVAINQAGFRGPEPTPEPYDGRRVIVLGDSIAYGIQLPDEATFPHKLQRALRDSAPGGDVEVLNLAVGGYDVLQEVALLAHRGLAYRPDVVVLAFCLNDVGIVSVNRDRLARQANAAAAEPSRWRLVELVRSRLETRREQERIDAENDPASFRTTYREQITPLTDDPALLALMARAPDLYPGPWYRDPDRIGRLRFAFQWLAGLADESGFDAVVAIVPFLHAPSGRYPFAVLHEIVAHEAHRAGLDVVDLTTLFLEAGMKDLRKAPRDRVHPNEDGHAIIARELQRYLERRGSASAPKLWQDLLGEESRRGARIAPEELDDEARAAEPTVPLEAIHDPVGRPPDPVLFEPGAEVAPVDLLGLRESLPRAVLGLVDHDDALL